MKERKSGPFNYMTLVGVIFLVVVAIALFNMLRTSDSGTVGIGEVGIGDKAAPFAVPLALSDLDGDANVDPDQACSVKGADVLRICDYFDRPLVMSFWFTKGASSCIDQQDVFDQVARRYRRRAGFVSINVRDDRDRVRELIEEHGWRVPVGYDRDGAVSNIYRVGGCPTFLFFRRGGILEDAEIGETDAGELGAQVRSLISGESQSKNQKAAAEEGTDPGG
ncbi:MAG: TlpA family protein disulfide reductase [Solirubrobacterales bacterium]|nr:TlpA family protein disulfide reductase [Solirubrobacterales bacterium]